MSTTKLIFASANPHKLDEIQSKLLGVCEVVSMAAFGLVEDIPETSETLEGNAAIKARFVYERLAQPCFADDSGLEVDALGGRPGVYSARYAGPNCTHEDNIRKLLHEMRAMSNRTARFRTVIHLCHPQGEFSVSGIVHGKITEGPRGNTGFGYDPIFVPDGSMRTFAEMSLEEKNTLSHRAIATSKLVELLRSLGMVGKHFC